MKVQSLLIVYKEKDEEFFKHLKNLIESNDDGEGGVVGTEDGTIRVFKCSEKQWLKHKEKGRVNKLADKFLFIDDMKDISVAEPVYDKYGITYGKMDESNYAIIVDERYEWNEETYKEFQEEFKKLKDDMAAAEEDAYGAHEEAKEEIKKKGPFLALGVLFPPALLLAGGMVAKNVSEAIKNYKILRSQMLYYAVTKVYLEELDAFMKQ